MSTSSDIAHPGETAPVQGPSASARPHNPLLAIALRVGATFSLATMFMLFKLAGDHGVSMPELMFWRQAVSVPIILGALLATGQIGKLATRRPIAHAGRAAVGTAGLFCNIAASVLLPLPVATTLGFTAPLFAVLITALVVREYVGYWRWTAVIAGFAGVLIIAGPGEIANVPTLGVVAGLGAGIIVATVSFQIRSLARTDTPISMVFWFAMFGMLGASVFLPFYARPHDAQTYLILLALGIAGTMGQFFVAASLRYGSVATVVVIDYVSLIWSTSYGLFIFGSWPPHTTWLGAPLIIVAGLIITWREHYLSKRISPTSTMDPGALEETAGDQPRDRRGT
ncbi:DMT family transporter [Novosphingobium sp. 1949]|uniref:DMT family transporter n=1 Tax=Novosphingobium organovorum TaxID=2930092 RepID=A0ABT0B8S9_9SPHN|nr:DMT family transporter [Novosphingobium organovorum]MCJ2181199.1 DMT family transporter [Novosphingobium organovorum]